MNQPNSAGGGGGGTGNNGNQSGQQQQQHQQQQQQQGNRGGTTGPGGGDQSIKSLLMNPMIGSQQSANMTNGLGQQLDLGQQLQQQPPSLVTPSLQTPNTPTSIPEIVFTGKWKL